MSAITLTAGDLKVYKLLVRYARDGFPMPSLPVLAAAVGYKGRLSAAQSLTRLETACHIEKKYNGRRVSEYIITASGRSLKMRPKTSTRKLRYVSRETKTLPALIRKDVGS